MQGTSGLLSASQAASEILSVPSLLGAHALGGVSRAQSKGIGAPCGITQGWG
jgi:hypothetical protein